MPPTSWKTSETSAPRPASAACAASMSSTTSCRPSIEPGAALVMPWPMTIERVRAGRRQLHDAEVIRGSVVDVHPPAQALVERLRSVDVGDGHDHDLEPHVHGLPLSSRGRAVAPVSTLVGPLGERFQQLLARADPELGEHLAQVPLDGARAEEQLRADLGVRQAVARQPGDVLLLGVSSSRVSSRRLRTFSPVASSSWRARSANASAPIGGERLVRGPQLFARVDAPPSRRSHSPYSSRAPGEFGAQPASAEAVDRLAVQALGSLAVAQQRAPARLAGDRPLGLAALGLPEQPIERALRDRDLAGPARGLDQLVERPRRDEELRGVVAGLEWPPRAPPRNGRARSSSRRWPNGRTGPRCPDRRRWPRRSSRRSAASPRSRGRGSRRGPARRRERRSLPWPR